MSGIMNLSLASSNGALAFAEEHPALAHAADFSHWGEGGSEL
jgi:hypothetical protein